MKIDRIETGSRTVSMLSNFLHQDAEEIGMNDDLRQDWKMTDKDFEVLEIWIEGPISKSRPGYFQDVQTNVSVSDLQDSNVVDTVESLAELIWDGTPDSNKEQ